MKALHNVSQLEKFVTFSQCSHTVYPNCFGNALPTKGLINAGAAQRFDRRSATMNAASTSYLNDLFTDANDDLDPNQRYHNPTNRRWRPELTGYRILTVLLTAGFGLSKAILSYRGLSTAPTTVDWLYGVVVFLS